MKIKSTRSVLHLTVTVAALALVSLANAQTDRSEGSSKRMMKPQVGLGGYCPVCVVAKRKWEKGNPNISSTFDGVTYYFPGKTIKAAFDKAPQKFVPALNGDCIVCYEKHGKRVPGKIHHAALHKGRLYLFPSENEKSMFVKSPKMFENSDLAHGGECIVCLAKSGKHVPGNAKHTVIHNGLRYQFPSENEAKMFRNAPEQFVASIKQMKGNEVIRTSSQSKPVEAVRIVGRSACAGCEFGVHPLGAPAELGLAIIGTNGAVTVVEGAHKNYPSIYKARFDGKQLVAEGKVIKTKGKTSWLQPTSLKVVN